CLAILADDPPHRAEHPGSHAGRGQHRRRQCHFGGSQSQLPRPGHHAAPAFARKHRARWPDLSRTGLVDLHAARCRHPAHSGRPPLPLGRCPRAARSAFALTGDKAMNYQAPVRTTLLEVRNLRTEFQTPKGIVRAVDGVSFTIERSERVAVVGESGSGKSAMAMSILRLLSHPGKVAGGEVLLEGRDLSKLSERQLNAVRGRLVGTVFQDPMSSLDPVMRISRQMSEPIMRNLRLTQDAARAEAIKWLGKV